jgi:light-regulated signal transduction histidine kinase (bacteriophytochrome)
MGSTESRQPRAAVQRQLDGAAAQFAWYARDLLANALKFSQEEKSIRVKVRATAEKVTLTIPNHGQGVSAHVSTRACPTVPHRRCDAPLLRDRACSATRERAR